MTDAEFELLRSLMYQQSGIQLSDAKRELLKGRLGKRLRHYGYASFAQYYDHLKNNDSGGTELQEMINAVTTHKTSFFRESHHFDYLRDHLLLPARQAAAEGRRSPIRIWSAGCSSGEEAYSIAITVVANLDRLATWDIKILGSDIDTDVVQKARKAVYPQESVNDLPQEVLRRNFLAGRGEQAGFVQLKPEIRNLVRFGRLNLMGESWPFRGKFDAIFCRNVIIYFDKPTQQSILKKIARCLLPRGWLFMGHAETLHELDLPVEPIAPALYRRINGRA